MFQPTRQMVTEPIIFLLLFFLFIQSHLEFRFARQFKMPHFIIVSRSISFDFLFLLFYSFIKFELSVRFCFSRMCLFLSSLHVNFLFSAFLFGACLIFRHCLGTNNSFKNNFTIGPKSFRFFLFFAQSV